MKVHGQTETEEVAATLLDPPWEEMRKELLRRGFDALQRKVVSETGLEAKELAKIEDLFGDDAATDDEEETDGARPSMDERKKQAAAARDTPAGH